MLDANLSFKGLEVFQVVAKTGSVQAAAKDTGLSASTISHHLKNLEKNLGVKLLNHDRRPMSLTPSGALFLKYVEDGLRLIRQGEKEITSGNFAEALNLRFGVVDDFDSELAPDMAQFLARAMPKCTFSHFSRPSHEIIQLLLDRKLDIGVAARPQADLSGLIEYPILAEPFVVAVSMDEDIAPEKLLAGESTLPLLRYSKNQVIGKLIEAQLNRLRVSLPSRFEGESNQSIIGMVAEGRGWAVTTPASYARARRYQDRVRLHPFPGKDFSRTLSLFTSDIYPEQTALMIAQFLRHLIRQNFIGPAIQNYPWLQTGFRLLEGPELSRVDI